MLRTKRLDDDGVLALKAKRTRHAYPDPELRGHYIRVTPTGLKSFWVVARDPSGKQHWRPIGSPPMSIVEARKRAANTINSLRAATPNSFESISAQWRKLHCEARKLRSLKEIDRHLRRMNEAWGRRDFASIGRGDIATLLDSIELNNGARQATYVLQVFSSMANWYAARNDHYRSPVVKGMRRGAVVKRDRVLNDDELRAVWKEAEAAGTYGALIRFALLTGQREDKVVSMRWADIDGSTWTVATAEREKGNAGVLDLPAAAVAIVEAQPRVSDYVFPGEKSLRKFTNWTNKKARLDAKVKIAPWRLHDLRRTAKSLMARAGIRPNISERVLGHAIDGVEGIYDRHDYRAEKAHALKALAALVETIVNPPSDNVVAMHG